MENKQKFCKGCNDLVLATKEPMKIGCVAHVGFAIMSFIGLVLFFPSLILIIPLWFMSANYDNSKFHCTRCGAVCK